MFVLKCIEWVHCFESVWNSGQNIGQGLNCRGGFTSRDDCKYLGRSPYTLYTHITPPFLGWVLRWVLWVLNTLYTHITPPFVVRVGGYCIHLRTINKPNVCSVFLSIHVFAFLFVFFMSISFYIQIKMNEVRHFGRCLLWYKVSKSQQEFKNAIHICVKYWIPCFLSEK